MSSMGGARQDWKQQYFLKAYNVPDTLHSNTLKGNRDYNNQEVNYRGVVTLPSLTVLNFFLKNGKVEFMFMSMIFQ